MGWEMLLGLCEFELPLKGSAYTLSVEWLTALWEFAVLKALLQQLQFHNLFLILVVLLSRDVSTVLFSLFMYLPLYNKMMTIGQSK